MPRGSATISFAPFLATASLMARPITGCASVVFEPMTKMQPACLISSMELVIAPEPNALARPATVEAWHSRAQWSTLFVPTAARMNF